jgi:hypothetical protein
MFDTPGNNKGKENTNTIQKEAAESRMTTTSQKSKEEVDIYANKTVKDMQSMLDKQHGNLAEVEKE